jgi:hypothetical protein
MKFRYDVDASHLLYPALKFTTNGPIPPRPKGLGGIGPFGGI